MNIMKEKFRQRFVDDSRASSEKGTVRKEELALLGEIGMWTHSSTFQESGEGKHDWTMEEFMGIKAAVRNATRDLALWSYLRYHRDFVWHVTLFCFFTAGY